MCNLEVSVSNVGKLSNPSLLWMADLSSAAEMSDPTYFVIANGVYWILSFTRSQDVSEVLQLLLSEQDRERGGLCSF